MALCYIPSNMYKYATYHRGTRDPDDPSCLYAKANHILHSRDIIFYVKTALAKSNWAPETKNENSDMMSNHLGI